MVKNTKGGNNKNVARKNMGLDRSLKLVDLQKTEDQCYAKVTKVQGGNRYKLECDDGVERLGVSRGNMNRGVRIGMDSFVLVALRDFGKDIADIVYAYNTTETNLLRQNGDLEKFNSSECKTDIDNIDFADL